VATCGESTSVSGPEQEQQAPAKRGSIETDAQLQRITQEFRRPRQQIPREAHASDDPEVFADALERLERRITAHLPGGRLTLAVTDNRHTMISVKRDKGQHYRARVHHMFLEAPPVIARALARYIAHNEAASSRALGQFIDENQHVIKGKLHRQPAETAIVTRGTCFDLQAIFDALNARYFQGAIDAKITWGGRGGQRRRRVSMKMGSYAVEDRLIRIHPALDREFVPGFFVEWIVFHEMLHHVHPVITVGRRRLFHSREFMAHERTFHDYPRAREWERRNLDRLLTY
jgi:hypothetical protein